MKKKKKMESFKENYNDLSLFFSDDLLADQSSFIYGQSPSVGNVPIYAMVTLCNSQPIENEPEGKIDSNGIYIKKIYGFMK